MDVLGSGTAAKLSACPVGALVHIKAGTLDGLAVKYLQNKYGEYLVVMPFDNTAIFHTAMSFSERDTIVTTFGIDWVLDLRQTGSRVRDQATLQSFGISRSSEGVYIASDSRITGSNGSRGFIRLDDKDGGDPEYPQGPVIEYSEWDIWASAADRDHFRGRPLLERRSTPAA